MSWTSKSWTYSWSYNYRLGSCPDWLLRQITWQPNTKQAGQPPAGGQHSASIFAPFFFGSALDDDLNFVQTRAQPPSLLLRWSSPPFAGMQHTVIDEDYYLAPCPYQAAVYSQPSIDDEIWPTPPAVAVVDDDYFASPTIQPAGIVGQVTFDDEALPILGVDEDYSYAVAPAQLPLYRQPATDDEILARVTFDEDYVYVPPPWVAFFVPQPPREDEIWTTAPPVLEEDLLAPLPRWQVPPLLLRWGGTSSMGAQSAPQIVDDDYAYTPLAPQPIAKLIRWSGTSLLASPAGNFPLDDNTAGLLMVGAPVFAAQPFRDDEVGARLTTFPPEEDLSGAIIGLPAPLAPYTPPQFFGEEDIQPQIPVDDEYNYLNALDASYRPAAQPFTDDEVYGYITLGIDDELWLGIIVQPALLVAPQLVWRDDDFIAQLFIDDDYFYSIAVPLAAPVPQPATDDEIGTALTFGEFLEDDFPSIRIQVPPITNPVQVFGDDDLTHILDEDYDYVPTPMQAALFPQPIGADNELSFITVDEDYYFVQVASQNPVYRQPITDTDVLYVLTIDDDYYRPPTYFSQIIVPQPPIDTDELAAQPLTARILEGSDGVTIAITLSTTLAASILESPDQISIVANAVMQLAAQITEGADRSAVQPTPSVQVTVQVTESQDLPSAPLQVTAPLSGAVLEGVDTSVASVAQSVTIALTAALIEQADIIDPLISIGAGAPPGIGGNIFIRGNIANSFTCGTIGNVFKAGSISGTFRVDED